jgi:cytochrome c-type biogenesis protein CcmH
MPPTSAHLDKLKRQLAQLDALVAEGVLTGDAARKSRDDLERQIVAAVLADDAEPAAESAPRPSRRLLAGVAVFVLAFGLAGYAGLGNRAGWAVGPGSTAPDGSVDAASQAAQDAQIQAMVDKLAARLKDKPDDADGWAMLARSYTAQGRYAQALPAFKRVVELRPKDAQALADYADGLAVVNNRSLEGEPEKLVLQAVKLDPSNVKALVLAGTIAFNRSQFAPAVGYWERALKLSDPASDFTRQLQGALEEARQRGGLPAAAGSAPSASPASPAPGARQAMAQAPAVGATVSGRVSLRPGLKSQVGADDTVFIFARAPAGSKMPLAILRKKVRDLPIEFTLDESMAMSPAASLATAQQVVVGARISKSGLAAPSPGDWQVFSAPVAVGASGLNLEIGEPVP